MILLRHFFLTATLTCAVVALADEPAKPVSAALPWQAQFNARPENLPPGERARPQFGRSAFVITPRAPSAETNSPAAPANSALVIAPVPSAKTLSPSLKNKPVFAEYRLEIIGVNRPKPAAPKPVVPVVVAPAPIVLAVKPTTPVQTKSGKPTFTELPPANPNFPFHAATSVVQTKPAPESVASEMPAPLAALPAVAETKPKKKTAPTKVAKESVAKPKLIVNADNGLGGRVASADEAGRFVVLNFPLGQMPRVDSTMTLYRHGVKSATIKITGPQRDDNIAADVLSGSPAEGDAAREE